MGREAKAGDVICLIGDLGVGKTVFTQGFAAGLGITEPVSSPTFTIVQTYDEGRIPFYHFDVYRIGDVEEMEEIGFDEYIFGEGVCLSMGQSDEEILPPHYRTVKIEKVLEKGFDYRMITIEAEENCCEDISIGELRHDGFSCSGNRRKTGGGIYNKF